MGNCLKRSDSDDIHLIAEDVPAQVRDGSSMMGPPPPHQQQQQLMGPPPPYHVQETIQPHMYYPSPNVGRPAAQLSEEEQIKIAQRMGLIQHLPTGVFDGSKKNRECAICMNEFVIGDPIRFLPCMHIYHTECIDDWLMRSFTCPSCMEPVDAALLSTYQTD